MEMEKILKEIQDQQTKSDKILAPKFDKDLVRKHFIYQLNKLCLESSKGKKGLSLDEETKKAIELVCQYLNNEKEFESNPDYALHKGLWLAGNFGSGKTQLIESYKIVKSILAKETVSFQTCNDMNLRFMQKNETNNDVARFDGIKMFANKFDEKERIFDDLGAEETTVMDYGNKVCVMAHILSERYKGFRAGVITHITTNLSMEQIKNKYGGRIESRTNEVFNVIYLGSKSDSKDYRKTK